MRDNTQVEQQGQMLFCENVSQLHTCIFPIGKEIALAISFICSKRLRWSSSQGTMEKLICAVAIRKCYPHCPVHASNFVTTAVLKRKSSLHMWWCRMQMLNGHRIWWDTWQWLWCIKLYITAPWCITTELRAQLGLDSKSNVYQTTLSPICCDN